MQVYETESTRLCFRRLQANDFNLVASILQDAKTMYNWEHGFSYDEVCDWLADNLNRYHADGSGCMAVFQRNTQRLVGLAGLLLESPKGETERCASLLYIIRHDYWGNGYGIECAKAMVAYGFEQMKVARITALIRVDNIPALVVAAGCGMQPVQRLKMDYGGKMVGLALCEIRKDEYLKDSETTEDSSENK